MYTDTNTMPNVPALIENVPRQRNFHVVSHDQRPALRRDMCTLLRLCTRDGARIVQPQSDYWLPENLQAYVTSSLLDSIDFFCTLITGWCIHLDKNVGSRPFGGGVDHYTGYQ